MYSPQSAQFSSLHDLRSKKGWKFYNNLTKALWNPLLCLAYPPQRYLSTPYSIPPNAILFYPLEFPLIKLNLAWIFNLALEELPPFEGCQALDSSNLIFLWHSASLIPRSRRSLKLLVTLWCKRLFLWTWNCQVKPECHCWTLPFFPSSWAMLVSSSNVAWVRVTCRPKASFLFRLRKFSWSIYSVSCSFGRAFFELCDLTKSEWVILWDFSLLFLLSSNPGDLYFQIS